jgi:hypothetical protein
MAENRSRLDIVRRKVALWDDGKQWRLRLRVSDTNRLRFTVSARNAKSLMGQSPLPKKFHRSIAGNEKFLLLTHTIHWPQFLGPRVALCVLSLLGLRNHFHGMQAEAKPECRVSSAIR